MRFQYRMTLWVAPRLPTSDRGRPISPAAITSTLPENWNLNPLGTKIVF